MTAGLSLYQKGHCNFTVYEQDETDSSRQQGYGLTILQGFNALKKLNVIDKVAAFDTPSRSHFIFDSSGKLINFFGSAFYAQEDGQVKKKNKFNIHIARQLLRNTLLKEIPPQYIQWNKKITNITNEGRDVIFNDGSRVENVDLIIGADGIYSQVRKLSIQDDLPLNYLGIIVVLGLCHSLHHLTKERVFQTVDGSTRLFAMPFFAPGLLMFVFLAFFNSLHMFLLIQTHFNYFISFQLSLTFLENISLFFLKSSFFFSNFF